jgi:hypothetical protein
MPLPRGLLTSVCRAVRRWHELGEPPPDQSSSSEHLRLASECAACGDETSAFCCVGVPDFCAGGRLPHNIAASAEEPQRALLHLVEWEHQSARGTRVETCVERQCASCAQTLLETGCPLAIVPAAAFRNAERRERAATESETDGTDAQPQRPSQKLRPPNGFGHVYRRGRVLLHVLPGNRPLLVNPRERPCVLCDAGPETGGRLSAHKSTCPCVNAESRCPNATSSEVNS